MIIFLFSLKKSKLYSINDINIFPIKDIDKNFRQILSLFKKNNKNRF